MSERIKSYIVVDTETTNLIGYGSCKITEIAVWGVLREHLMESQKCEMPRIVQKMSFATNPIKMVHFVAADITGLDNFMLDPLRAWDEDLSKLFLLYLDRFPKPVCLIAHNGLNFDFPIIKAHFNRTNMSLPEDLRCVDSYLGFKSIFSLPRSDTLTLSNGIQTAEPPGSGRHSPPGSRSFKEKDLAAEKSFQSGSLKEENEKTPQSTTIQPNLVLKKRKEASAGGNITSAPVNAKRRLFANDIPDGVPTSYKLENIFKFLYRRPPNQSHSAEGDVEALWLCIVKTPGLLEWIDKNHTSLNTVKPRS